MQAAAMTAGGGWQASMLTPQQFVPQLTWPGAGLLLSGEVMRLQVAAAVAGASQLGGTAQLLMPITGQPLVGGAAVTIGQPLQLMALALGALTASSSLTAHLLGGAIYAALAGSGVLSGASQQRMTLAAPLAGVSAVTPAETMWLPLRTAPWSAVAAMSNTFSAAMLSAATMSGAGAIILNDLFQKSPNIGSLLAGAGGANWPSNQWMAANPAILTGAGGGTRTIYQQQLIKATHAGAGAFSGNVTQVSGSSAFDPAYLQPPGNGTLSNGNNSLNSGTYNLYFSTMSRTTKSYTTGVKRYAEMTVTNLGSSSGYSGAGYIFSGFNPPADGSYILGSDTAGATWGLNAYVGNYYRVLFQGSVSFTGPAPPAGGDVIMMAIDTTGALSAGRALVWIGINGTWLNGPPSGGSGTAVGSFGIPITLWLAANVSNVATGSDIFTVNTGGSAFAYSLPSGFVAWG